MNEDYMVNGQCQDDCGKCCSSILPLNDHEIKKIKQYIRRNNIQPLNKNTNIYNDEYVDVCPFLTETNRCKIYIHRPEVCKRFFCGDRKLAAFNHRDKHMVNMLTEFFPDEPCYNAPNVKEIDSIYQNKKEKAYG